MALDERDLRLLEFEGSWWTLELAKAVAIRDVLSMSPAAYYRRLAELVDDPDARQAAPLVVRRLERRRLARRRSQLEGTLLAERPHP